MEKVMKEVEKVVKKVQENMKEVEKVVKQVEEDLKDMWVPDTLF